MDIILSQLTPIPSHVFFAWGATFLGVLQFSLPKGTKLHRYLGIFWVVAMAYVAMSSFFIHQGRLWGPFNWIHLLSVLTLILLVWAIQAARSGNIRLHSRLMIFHFISANIITGAFTFMPGRTMHQVLFGS